MSARQVVNVAMILLFTGIGCGHKTDDTQKSGPRATAPTVAERTNHIQCKPNPSDFQDDPTKLIIEAREGVMFVSPNCRVLPGTTTKTEIDSIFGKANVRHDGFSKLYDIYAYDQLGIKLATRKSDDILEYIDIYVNETKPIDLVLTPKKMFRGKLSFNGQIIRATTKKSDFISLGFKPSDYRVAKWGFYLQFRDADIGVDLAENQEFVENFRFMEPLGK